jgi:hypothetical protein
MSPILQYWKISTIARAVPCGVKSKPIRRKFHQSHSSGDPNLNTRL